MRLKAAGAPCACWWAFPILVGSGFDAPTAYGLNFKDMKKSDLLVYVFIGLFALSGILMIAFVFIFALPRECALHEYMHPYAGVFAISWWLSLVSGIAVCFWSMNEDI